MSEKAGKGDDRQLRRNILERLYDAYCREGLYRGVVSQKELGKQLAVSMPVLERNLEYLLERELIRMHKIEDLISISTSGIDIIESGLEESQGSRIEKSLERIENLLTGILSRLDKEG